ncbi:MULTISPECIES: TIGR01906 family membrane protein [unclassified Clostridium]|uniref:TIGR01906 family membrane protein n=1 Tax=unclassified Clostridium TaxID=2614128 RepID=UPI000297E8FB|nr:MULTISPECIES: TIGR01906 family membrane protein [unclassified Clostridium]EKQ57854.1 MAG: integral membrane protein TIGR01906 [Clostridium sp. Maddingley MBC34-26]
MIFRLIRNIFYAISIISISVLAVLNTTIVYRYAIEKYELNKYTGLSTEALMDNYKRVINYVQNPFDKELVLNNVPMSEFGRIHFFEVKRIFVALYIISIVFVLIMIFKLITNKNKDLGKRLIEDFNGSMNIAALIFIFVSIAAAIDFSKTFYFFHKIFFRNNYWIFDPATDPIINALPEEFFMTELILVVALLIIFTLIIKTIYFKSVFAIKRRR